MTNELFPNALRPPSPMQIHHVTVEFDGGNGNNIPSRGYGEGYGSYQITWNDHKQPIERVRCGRPMSNNVAEMSVLILALKRVRFVYLPERTKITIEGDSQLALRRCEKPPKSKRQPGGEDYHDTAALLLSLCMGFLSVTTQWRGRAASVKLFGH